MVGTCSCLHSKELFESPALQSQSKLRAGELASAKCPVTWIVLDSELPGRGHSGGGSWMTVKDAFVVNDFK